MGERDFFFPKKRQDKKVSWRIFATLANASPIYQVTCCRSVHSDWIVRTTAALLYWGYLPVVFLIAQMVSTPCIHTLYDPIALVLVVPNATADITRTCAHLKPVTCAKQFPASRFSGCTITKVVVNINNIQILRVKVLQ